MADASVIALIPARSSSKRIPDKNIKPLGKHPLLAYTIRAACDSGIFSRVLVSTDSERYAEIARYYGAEVPFLRPEALSGDKSPDIEWVEFTLERLRAEGHSYDCFSLLRPTSPFRSPDTIKRAWAEFQAAEGIDSLRAIERCAQHPGKMWVVRNNRMLPLLPLSPAEQPWHSTQMAALPEVYVQNASLEIGWTRIVFEARCIAGVSILPFFTQGAEGFDVNQPYDWVYAQYLIDNHQAVLPDVKVAPFKS